jgi:Tfp pilus assembly protein PilF
MAEKKTKELTKEQIEAKQKELAKKIRTAPISEIAHKIKNCSEDGGKRCNDARFAVFLGAGASFQAEIKTAGQMMSEFRREILKRDCPEITDKKKQEEWLDKNILGKGEGNEYSKLFERFERTRTGRQKYISKLIKDKIPTFGYAMLASIIARGFINTILTTNFDDLIFIACNKFTGVRPVIYAYGIMATEMKFSSPHTKILKMHGDYLYSTLANTEKEMTLYNQDPNMKAQVAHALNEYELIVFGYSGSDDSVMNILENYPDGKELYWCHWSKELPSLRALELLHKKDGTLVAIEGFDDAMYDIYKIVDFELDEVLASYEERRNEIRRFIDIFREKYPNTIIEESIQETKQPEPKSKKEPSTWFEYFEAGYQANENKDFTTAEKMYRKAIKLNQKSAAAYSNLGFSLKNTNRLVEAEKMYRKAIEMNPNLARTYNNLGNLLVKDANRFDEAEEMFQKAIQINPNYESPYYNLACLRSISRKEENKEEAFKYLKMAVEMNSKNKVFARTEADFDFVRDDERFWEIVGRDEEE